MRAISFPNVTKRLEDGVKKAFKEHNEKFSRELVEQKFYPLRKSHNPNLCCAHSWRDWVPTDDTAKYFEAITEESPSTAEKVCWCAKCGAVGYFDQGKLWLYDATTYFFGKIPKRRRDLTRE